MQVCGNDSDRWVFWCAGIALLAHMLSFLSVSYFGQMVASFFLFAGITAGISFGKISSVQEQIER